VQNAVSLTALFFPFYFEAGKTHNIYCKLLPIVMNGILFIIILVLLTKILILFLQNFD